MRGRPGSYTHGHHESVLRSHRWRTVENSAAYLVPYLRPGLSLLDVGCGPGTITGDLAQRLAPGQVVGIDPAEEAIAAARASLLQATAEAVPVDDQVGDPDGGPHEDPAAFDFGAGAGPVPTAMPRFEVADALGFAETYPNERFDVVHAHQVLQHVADPVATLRVMGWLAVPGGLVAARDSDCAAMTWYPQLPELTDWMRLYRAATQANGGEPDAGRRLKAWARAAGFTEISASASTWCFASAEERAWWAGLWAERMVESDLARQLVDGLVASSADLARIADGWRRWVDDPDGWFAVLHGEIICRVPAGSRPTRTQPTDDA